jgi:hypothetical protein
MSFFPSLGLTLILALLISCRAHICVLTLQILHQTWSPRPNPDVAAYPRKIYDDQNRPWSLKRGKHGQAPSYQLATTGPPEERSWPELWATLPSGSQRALAHLAPPV